MAHKGPKKAVNSSSGITIKVTPTKRVKSSGKATKAGADPAEASNTPNPVKKSSKKANTDVSDGADEVDSDVIQTSGNASWTKEETHRLLALLEGHKAAAGDGGNFKRASYSAVAVEIEKMRTSGGPKLWTTCRDKFRSLKTIYYIVLALKENSGWAWSDAKGCNIDATSQACWDAYVKKHKGCLPFRNAGWEFLEGMEKIVTPKPRGKHVFNPLQLPDEQVQESPRSSPQPDVSSHPAINPADYSQDWDLDQMDRDFASSTPARQGSAVPSFGAASQEVLQEVLDLGDDSDEDVKPAPVSSRKRRVAAQPAPVPASKRVRTSTSAPAAAIGSVADSIARFGETIGSALASNAKSFPEDTPKRANKAIKRAQLNEAEWLTDEQMLRLFELFETNKSAVTTYCSLDPGNIGFIRKWIAMKLNITLVE
ncbi:hypothetical protein C8J56DRAFT_1173005 [Mycena floridula]|nr:hypothetical protein C8J56DRAFT_1173005 [Mycena floridula]